MSGALRDAVLLSFDNLGEAADLERHGAPPRGPHPSVTVGLPRALDALAALDLRATFFVEGLNAELYPQALRDIAAAGHEVGLHGWRHERWDELSARRRGRAAGPRRRRARGAGPRDRGLPPARRRARGAHHRRAGRARPALVLARRRARGAPGRRRQLPFRWPAVDAYHRLESFTDRRTARGDRAAVASPREAADALIGVLDARGDEPLVLILHPFLLLEDDEVAQARRVLEHLAGQVARGERWVAPGRELAPLVGA